MLKEFFQYVGRSKSQRFWIGFQFLQGRVPERSFCLDENRFATGRLVWDLYNIPLQAKNRELRSLRSGKKCESLIPIKLGYPTRERNKMQKEWSSP